MRPLVAFHRGNSTGQVLDALVGFQGGRATYVSRCKGPNSGQEGLFLAGIGISNVTGIPDWRTSSSQLNHHFCMFYPPAL